MIWRINKVYCENLVKENEASTLWKIKDCEGKLILINKSLELLQKRVSDTYVKDAISLLESKINNQINKGHNDTVKKATSSMAEKVDSKISQMSKILKDDISSCKRTLGFHESMISK